MSKQQEVTTSLWYGAGMLAITLLLALSQEAKACDWVEIGGVSHHYDRSKDYREINPTLGCEINKVSLTYFKNSHDWDTFMLDRSFQVVQIGDLELGARVGVVKGYRDKIPSFSKLLDDRLESTLGDGAQSFLDEIAPAFLPYARWEFDSRSRLNCYAIYTSAIACTMAFELW